MRKHMLKALPVLAALGLVGTIPAAAATTQHGLFDLGNTPYNWSVTARQYKAIALNDWNAGWAAQIKSAGSHAYVYKDLTSTRESDCGSNPAGGASCIVNGRICPPGVHDAPYYAGGLGFCWTWRNHRSWFLRDSRGRLLNEAGFRNSYVMDYGNRGYQAAWLSATTRDAHAHGWKYIFADNALDNNSYGTPAKYPTPKQVQAAMLAMLKVVGPGLHRAGIGLVPNLGYTNLFPSLWGAWIGYVSGFMNEHNTGNVSQQVSICRTRHKTCFFNLLNDWTVTYIQG